jgi:DNA-binding transcriptional LysR family regulator
MQQIGLPKSVTELAQHTCIDYAHVRANDLWQFNSEVDGGRPLSVLMRGRIIANNFEAMRDMAIAGLGLVLLPEFLAAGPLREGTLISALPHATPRPHTISAVYPYTRHVSSKVHPPRLHRPRRTWLSAVRGTRGTPRGPWKARSASKCFDSWRKKKTRSWANPWFEVVIACAVETNQSE